MRGEYVPDPIERAEACAEDGYYSMTEGMPDGMFRCECGYAGHFDTAVTLYDSAWALPVCCMFSFAF